MQVILRPTSRPELDEIIINDCLFAIGRHESPFSNYPEDATHCLSRRHARIFEEGEQIYLTDLGSKNGTTHNGKKLGRKPVALNQGDEICLASQFTYKVEILGRARENETRQDRVSARLELKPTHADSGLDPVIITSFPFLVSKTSEVFARYLSTNAAETSYLSRRHAHIFRAGNKLFIEDLGSTNGTFVAGKRLEEQAREIHNGETLAFGGNYFVYTAQLEFQAAPAAATDKTGAMAAPANTAAMEPPGSDGEEKTTFISTANSFLDIFCIDDEEDEAPANQLPEQAQRTEAGTEAQASRLPGWLSRPRTFLGELREALTEDNAAPSHKARWIIGGAIAVLLAVGLVIYTGDGTQQNIREYIAEGRFDQASTLANELLAADPGDKDILQLANEALLGNLVPAWVEQLHAADFVAARQLLDTARTRTTHNPDGSRMLDLLLWSTDMEDFVRQRGGIDAPFVMFDHEIRIQALLDRWDTDAKTHRRTLAHISRLAPAFAPVQAKVLSHLRALRNQESIYQPAIARLGTAIENELVSVEMAQIEPILTEFERKYPNTLGMARLRQDWSELQAIQQQLQAEKPIKAIRLLEITQLETPPFQHAFERMRQSSLPTQPTIEQYLLADAAWRKGEFDIAVRLMQELTTARKWGQLATNQLHHMQTIIDARRELAQLEGSPEYGEQLLAFYGKLDAEEDTYLIEEIEEVFNTHRDKALARADKEYAEALKNWQAYDSDHRIGGKERLEDRVSATFRKQAARLSAAYENIQLATGVYKVLRIDMPDAWRTLHATVTTELRLQRRSLQDMNMVLEPALLNRKLQLFTDLEDPDPNTMRVQP